MLENIHFFKEIRHSLSGIFWYFLLEGILLLCLGILVVIYPQIIILLFAFFFILAAAISFWIAIKIRKAVRKVDKFFDLI